MSTSNGKITAPVTILDVARTIGVASMDLGRLCTSSNVNKWSRYKPIGSTTADNIPQSEFKTYKEGGVSKPFGLLMPVISIGSYQATVEVSGDQTEPSVMNKASVWEYAQPQKDGSKVLGTINGKTIYGTVNDYRCRKADFNGYVHTAEPLFNIKWTDETSKGLGVKATVTLGSVDGGITLEDMGLAGCYLSLIVMSESEYTIKETGLAGRRYLIGGMDWNTKLIYDTTKTYEFSLNELYLSQVLDNMMLFFVVTDEKPTYDLFYESYQNGVGVNPDGWKANNAVFFPKMTNAGSISKRVMVDNSAIKVNMNAGVGNVLRRNDNSGEKKSTDASSNLTTVDRIYSELVYTTEVDGDSLNARADYIEFGYLNNGFDIKITKLGYSESRAAFRKLSIKVHANAVSGTYLNDYGNSLSSGQKLYKPLVGDLPMKGGTYKSVSIYIEFAYSTEYEGNISKKLIARFVSYNNDAVSYKVLAEGEVSDFVNNQNLYYHSITFANVVSVSNQIVGFEMKLNYSAYNSESIAKTITISEWLTDADGHHYPYFPLLETKAVGTDGDYEIVNYGDVHFKLPEGVANTVGNDRTGKLSISYEVIASDTQSSIGV